MCNYKVITFYRISKLRLTVGASGVRGFETVTCPSLQGAKPAQH